MSNHPIVKAIAMHPMSETQLEAFQVKIRTLLGRDVDVSVQVHIPAPVSANDTSVASGMGFNPELKKQWVKYCSKM